MTGKTCTGIARLVRAFCYSVQGLGAAWKNEAAFRQEIVLAALILPPGLWFAANNFERALLAASVIFVLVVELLNSGLEAAIDRISPERHELSKRSKDLGSAAVMLALVNVWVVWGLVFGARLF